MAKKKVEAEAVTNPALPVEDASKYLKTFSNGVKIISVKDVKNTKSSTYDMTVEFEHLPGTPVPFHATSDDTEEHGRWLFTEADKGTFGKAAEYERPLPTVEDLQSELDKLWPDVVLGIATEEELSLAKALRLQIKAMQ
jgi:hypothetical protein